MLLQVLRHLDVDEAFREGVTAFDLPLDAPSPRLERPAAMQRLHFVDVHGVPSNLHSLFQLTVGGWIRAGLVALEVGDEVVKDLRSLHRAGTCSPFPLSQLGEEVILVLVDPIEGLFLLAQVGERRVVSREHLCSDSVAVLHVAAVVPVE